MDYCIKQRCILLFAILQFKCVRAGLTECCIFVAELISYANIYSFRFLVIHKIVGKILALGSACGLKI